MTGLEVRYMELSIQDMNARLIIDINYLRMQLSPGTPPITEAHLTRMFESGTRLFGAFSAGAVLIGAVLLVPMNTLVSRTVWIEDMIVDKDFRGRGVTGILMGMAEEAGQQEGTSSVRLMSPSATSDTRGRGYQQQSVNVFHLTLHA